MRTYPEQYDYVSYLERRPPTTDTDNLHGETASEVVAATYTSKRVRPRTLSRAHIPVNTDIIVRD